jgi:hypothetical protein
MFAIADYLYYLNLKLDVVAFALNILIINISNNENNHQIILKKSYILLNGIKCRISQKI